MAVYFPPRPVPVRFASRNKINVPSPSSAALQPRASRVGAAPARASGTSLAIKAARGGSSLKEDRP